MRDLTEKELKLAPDWATHYTVDGFDDVIYQNETLCWWGALKSPLAHGCMDKDAVEINKKPFDITKHEFSDSNFKTKAYVSDGELIIGASEYEIPCFCANKDDAIAIAKALGVTGEDLK